MNNFGKVGEFNTDDSEDGRNGIHIWGGVRFERMIGSSVKGSRERRWGGLGKNLLTIGVRGREESTCPYHLGKGGLVQVLDHGPGSFVVVAAAVVVAASFCMFCMAS